MKKLLLIPLLVLLFACGPASMPEEAESTVGITAPDGFAVACAANYVRLAPHLCGSVTNYAGHTLIGDGSCRSVDFTSVLNIPSTSKAAIFYMISLTASINFYLDGACTTLIRTTQIIGATSTGYVTVPISNGIVRYISASGTPQLFLYGYYD